MLYYLSSSFLKGMVDSGLIIEAQAVSLMLRIGQHFQVFRGGGAYELQNATRLQTVSMDV